MPAFYRIFLKRMGIVAGDFKTESWFFHAHLHDINAETRLLMKENHVQLPARLFAFLMHQGYTSLFFIQRDADPEVFCYTEGCEIASTQMRFSQFMKLEIDHYLSSDIQHCKKP
ncbi:hypothetical protein DD235_00640 [Corticimicrobacter populi]|uniref:Uncharacterized protein n=2 Tax=Corticimicrobacter populi TaxID=2175229 RepID=A0A2V1K6Z5_9BURK|nr:hypothetical protein DD235_00640 [Corticimicrobacter populi]